MRKAFMTLFVAMVMFASFNTATFAFSGDEYDYEFRNAEKALSSYTEAIADQDPRYNYLKYLDLDTLAQDNAKGNTEILDLLKNFKKGHSELDDKYYNFYINTLSALPEYVKRLKELSDRESARFEREYTEFYNDIKKHKGDEKYILTIYEDMESLNPAILARFNNENSLIEFTQKPSTEVSRRNYVEALDGKVTTSSPLTEKKVIDSY